MESTNSEYGSPYLVVCHVTLSLYIRLWLKSVVFLVSLSFSDVAC